MFISFFYSFLKKNLFLTFRFYFPTKIFPDSLFINNILFSKYPTTINFLLFVQNIFIFFYLHFVKKFLSRYRYFIRKKKREKNETVSKLKLMIYRFACKECRSHCFVPWFPITMGHHCSLFFNNTPFSGEIASIIKLLFLKRKKKEFFFLPSNRIPHNENFCQKLYNKPIMKNIS